MPKANEIVDYLLEGVEDDWSPEDNADVSAPEPISAPEPVPGRWQRPPRQRPWTQAQMDRAMAAWNPEENMDATPPPPEPVVRFPRMNSMERREMQRRLFGPNESRANPQRQLEGAEDDWSPEENMDTCEPVRPSYSYSGGGYVRPRRQRAQPQRRRPAEDGLKNFYSLNDTLGGRPRKKIAPNTFAIKVDDQTIAIRFHNTNVVTFNREAGATVNFGGYNTVTTRARVNEWLPRRWRLFQADGELYWCHPYRELGTVASGVKLPYTDGDSITPGGELVHQAPEVPRRQPRVRPNNPA